MPAAIRELMLASTPRAMSLALSRSLVIGLMAFLTVADLFATQAILPALAAAYRVSPAAMGTAVNACTIGMAIAGLAVSLLSARIDRRRGVVASLTLLAFPTALLSAAPDLATFTALRVAQGLCMASAFTLTLAYLAEETSGPATASAFAAYIAGNVASNLIGRLISASAADTVGIAGNFYLFSALNLLGAALGYVTLARMRTMAVPMPARGSALAAWTRHLSNRRLQVAFVIGFLILFAFVGIFTYVNFVLVGPPLSLGMMTLGAVYLVFLPSMLTTPLAGRLSSRFGASQSLMGSLLTALAALPLLLAPSLTAILAGLTLFAVGTFAAQAVATGYVGRTASPDPGAASGLYLASYFLGGMAGSAALGALFSMAGWYGCVSGVAFALVLAVFLARRIGEPSAA